MTEAKAGMEGNQAQAALRIYPRLYTYIFKALVCMHMYICMALAAAAGQGGLLPHAEHTTWVTTATLAIGLPRGEERERCGCGSDGAEALRSKLRSNTKAA